MRNNSWYNGLATGLVVMVCVAAMLLALLSDGLPSWWRHDGPIVTSSDTLANWLVAIFSIVASLFLWLTLRATRDMAKNTRRIGEAQVRAYLSIKSVSVAIGDGSTHPIVQLNVKNSGQSPARRIEVVAEFRFAADYEKVPPFSLADQVGVMWLQDMEAAGEITSMPTSLSDVKMDRQSLGPDLENLWGIHLNIVLYASDVFEKEIVAAGTYAIGWSLGEDKSALKVTNDMSDINIARFSVDKLRRKDRSKY